MVRVPHLSRGRNAFLYVANPSHLRNQEPTHLQKSACTDNQDQLTPVGQAGALAQDMDAVSRVL
jgi:hypothetical protein